jgi:hypothetical protein
VPGGIGFAGPGKRYVGTGDFDHDGFEEIAFFDATAGAIHLYGLTRGGVERRGTVTGPPGAFPVAMGDFTGDGVPDFVWRQPGGNQMALRRVVGDALGNDAVTQSNGLVALGNVLSVGGRGDYDGDGDLDLLLRLVGVGFAIAYLDDGRFERTVTLPAIDGDENRWVVGSVDVDGDGAMEIALQDQSTHRVAVVFPSSEVMPMRVPVLTPGLRWRVVDVR